MKKTEIVQLVFIVLGITLMLNIILTITQQLSLFRNQEGFPLEVLIPFLVSALLFALLAYLLILKSKFFAKKIIRAEEDGEVNLSIPKYEVLQLSVVIISLVLLIKLFIPFFSAVVQMAQFFIDDYPYFKEVFPTQMGTVMFYGILVFVFYHSKAIAQWLNAKFFTTEGGGSSFK